jgi:5-formyltetrahydrofolate cyclo-ligase
MTTVTKAKSELRRRFREERAARFSENSKGGLTPDFLHLLEAPEVAGATYVTSYISVKDEPDTSALNLAIIKSGKILLLPRVAHPLLEWVPWDGDRENLHENRGLLEPVGDPISELSLIDAVIVPALQVDQNGNRMGQGGGYYDRALPNMSGWKVGIIFGEEFASDPIPREDHDVALDAVATPTEIIRFS